MPELSVNLDELAFVLHRSPSLHLDCYLDLETGNILNVPTDRKVLENLLPPEENSQMLSTDNMIEQLLPKGGNLLFIPDLFEQHVFKLMIDFHKTLEEGEPELAEQLFITIHGEGGYASFRKLIQKRYQLLKSFIRFRDSFFEQEAQTWLKQNNISAIPRETNSQ
jgi:hypothetical protein